MYNGSSWEVLQESTHSIIENIKGYIRAVAYQRAGDYSTAAGFITSTDWARLFASATDADGNKIAEAHLSAFVQKDSNGNIVSGVKIGADQITFEGKTFTIGAEHIEFKGKTVINGKFSVDSNGNVTMDGFTATNATITGKVTASEGKIGGFTLSGNGLTHIVSQSDMSQSSNMGYIICRNDYYGRFAGIGANVLPATAGNTTAVARFENTDSHSWWSQNIALLLRAENGEYANFAFTGTGNGVLNGWIGGYKFSKFTCTTTNTIYDGYTPLKENNIWIVRATVDNSGVALPKLTEVRRALGVGSNTNFCVRLIISADLGSSSFSIYGRNRIENSSGNKPWNTTELPLMTHWNGGNWDSLDMGEGDTAEFLLIYDSSRTTKIDDYDTKYTARCINRQN